MTILLLPAVSVGYTAVAYMAPVALGYCAGSKVRSVVQDKLLASNNICVNKLSQCFKKLKVARCVGNGAGIGVGVAVALCLGTPAWLLVVTAMTVAYMKSTK